MARPSKYPEGDEERRKLFNSIREAGRAGKSLTQIAVHIDVARSTLYEWMSQHEAFSDAVKDAEALAQAWWEDLGQNMAMGMEGNPTAFIFQVKNRFHRDYKDKRETALTGAGGGPVKTEAVVDVSGLSAAALEELAALQTDDDAWPGA